MFCADLIRNLRITGTSWAKLGVNWDAALRELKDGPYPSMYLTISQRAHALICSPAVDPTIVSMQSGRTGPAGHERELVRQALADKLAADWPSYINGMITSGRLRYTA